MYCWFSALHLPTEQHSWLSGLSTDQLMSLYVTTQLNRGKGSNWKPGVTGKLKLFIGRKWDCKKTHKQYAEDQGPASAIESKNKYNQKRKTELLFLNKMKIKPLCLHPYYSKPKTIKTAPLHLMDLTSSNCTCVISSVLICALPSLQTINKCVVHNNSQFVYFWETAELKSQSPWLPCWPEICSDFRIFLRLDWCIVPGAAPLRIPQAKKREEHQHTEITPIGRQTHTQTHKTEAELGDGRHNVAAAIV